VNSGGGASQESGSAVVASGSQVTDQVGAQVHRLLGEVTTGRGNTPLLSPRGEGSTFAPDRAPGVPSCVLKATQRTQPPLASVAEPFQGKAAYLVVLPHPGDAGQVDAFVVNAACSTSGPGTVLFQATYPR
jgi:hypothetical protein